MENKPIWRREAKVWLDTAHPDLPAEKRDEFYEAVAHYHRENPTVERDVHFLSVLQEAHAAFPSIFHEIIADNSGSGS